MRKKVQHGFEGPVGLVIIEKVLRKTARIHNAKMRVDAGPAERRRLAAIIKPGPAESAGRPRTGIIIRPPGFRRLPPGDRVIEQAARRGGDVVVSGDIAVDGGVIRIDAACPHRAGRFRADDIRNRVTRVVGIEAAQVVIETLDINHLAEASLPPWAINGDGAEACGVQ